MTKLQPPPLSGVSPKTVEKAVNALLKWRSSKLNTRKPQLLEQDEFFYLILTLKKIPQKGVSRINAHKIPLPNSLINPLNEAPELCLIIDDRPKSGLNKDGAKKKIQNDNIPISKIIKLSKLKTDYRPFEAKRKLCDSYDMFFADKRVVPLLPKMSGKQFFKKKKIPVTLDLKHHNWKEQQIDRACGSALLYLRSGTCSVVKVGRISMSREEIGKNVMAAINGIADIVPRKWGGVRSFHLKLLDSLALPVYQAVPDLKMKIDGGPKEENEKVLVAVEEEKAKEGRVEKKKGKIQEDPEFAKFLESNKEHLQTLRDEKNQYSDEEESDEDGRESTNEMGKLNSSTVDSLCKLVKEQNNVPAFVRLLNGYRAACHYGSESPTIVEDSHTFSKILTFMFHEADNIFRKILGISESNDRKEAILELKNTSKWKTLKPIVKSYLRSTLFLLNEVTDSQILASALTRLRASMVFFAAFPLLLGRLIKISVHLWATGKGTLSACSLLIIKDVATVFNSNCFETCMIKAYKAFIDHCKFVEPVLFKHQQFLKSSFIELCSQDLQKAYNKAMVSIQQLAKILQLGLRTKKKEAVKKICSWQYANCVDLWVAFISLNIRDYDLQPLLYTIIQIINGVAVLFPGPRYMPLRVKCVQWLNALSESSGVFIPITSLVLDILEYKIGKESSKPGKDFSFSSAVKLPKHWPKSRNFQDECVFSAIELLAVHFAQWSYHISFPDLATIPLIYLRKFHELTTIESLRRVVKRFIDQVEQNIEFVRKKRDEVTFSPNDQQSAESFLQLEKGSDNAPFTKYYTSVIEKAGSRNLVMNGKISSLEQKKSKGKRQQIPKNAMDVDLAVNAEGNSH